MSDHHGPHPADDNKDRISDKHGGTQGRGKGGCWTHVVPTAHDQLLAVAAPLLTEPQYSDTVSPNCLPPKPLPSSSSQTYSTTKSSIFSWMSSIPAAACRSRHGSPTGDPPASASACAVQRACQLSLFAHDPRIPPSPGLARQRRPLRGEEAESGSWWEWLGFFCRDQKIL